MLLISSLHILEIAVYCALNSLTQNDLERASCLFAQLLAVILSIWKGSFSLLRLYSHQCLIQVRYQNRNSTALLDYFSRFVGRHTRYLELSSHSSLVILYSNKFVIHIRCYIGKDKNVNSCISPSHFPFKEPVDPSFPPNPRITIRMARLPEAILSVTIGFVNSFHPTQSHAFARQSRGAFDPWTRWNII